MTRSCLCVLVFAASLSAAAMPSRSDLKKVQSTVNELMAEDIAAMKSGKQTPEGAAAKAEELAGLATDEASKFLLYKGAFGLYVQGGKYEEAVAALGNLTAAVKNVPDKVLADIVLGKMKKLSKKDGGAIFAYYEQLDRRIRYGEEKEKFAKLVRAEPSNRDAHKSFAVALAALGDWKGALAEFAQAGGDEQKAAKTEKDGQAASAADQWWACAGAAVAEDVQDVYRAHAAELYSKAIADGKIAGLKKALAEKRVAEVGSIAVQKKDEKQLETAEALPQMAVSVPNKRYDWSIPANFKGKKTVDLDLGNGQKMRFLAVKPGSAEVKIPNLPSHQVKITRPFWISQLCVTVPQYELFTSLEGHKWKCDKLAAAFKDDPDTLVYAAVGAHEAWNYMACFQRTYGYLLPKGMVFRLVTQGERALVESMGGEPFTSMEMQFKRLQAKGFLRELKNWKEVGGAEWKDEMKYSSVIFDAGKKWQDANYRCKWMPLGAPIPLDRISAPDLAGVNPYDKSRSQDFAKALAYQPLEVDPFRYCADDASDIRVCAGTLQIPDSVPVYISVVAGYDYVGEWKKKNGK